MIPAICATSSLAAAQDVAGQDRLGEMIERARQAYTVVRRGTGCRPGAADEIVVCATDSSRWRIPSTSESDPGGRQALADGRPHAPDLGPRQVGAVVAGGCFIPPCPGPPPYIIDLATIPEAPPGSDADRIARGELRAP